MPLLFLALPLIALSQGAHKRRTLIVNGQSGEAPVIEADGHTYVNLETLARIANGSVAFQGNQIVLTIPASSPEESSDSAFSKDFMKAAIEELSVIREWRNALKNAIERSYPISEDWVSLYRNQAVDGLRRTSIEASTDADRSALQLLTNELDNINALSDNYLEKNDNREFIPSDDLKDDPTYQKILTCSRGLASMISSGQYVDDPSCL
jgi:hypothetical protein